jgi:competence protein ComEA
MWEMIRGYLTFTRKERFGVLFLLIVISVLFILPYLFQPAIGKPDMVATEKMKEGIREFELLDTDSSRNTNKYKRYADPNYAKPRESAGYKNDETAASLFYFDPNNLNAAGWHKLGMSDHLIRTILNYVGKGGRFKQAEDLQKLYGLQRPEYERLFPFVRISENKKYGGRGSDAQLKTSLPFAFKSNSDSSAGTYGRSFLYPKKKFSLTDINQADSAKWSQLPGIGTKLASRIIHYRENLGGFWNTEQVGETFGLPDSTFQKIKPYLQTGILNLKQIDLNTASKETLQSHPYIRWQIANGIIAYRLQHGGFQSVEELMQLAQIDSGKFERLKPYVEVGRDNIR